MKERTETFTGVTPGELADLRKEWNREGAKSIEVKRQPDGTFNVTATFEVPDGDC